MAAAVFAGPVNAVSVTLPHPVTVGATTLPAGAYVISSFEMGGEDLFVVRGEHTAPVTLHGQRVGSDSDKTTVEFSKDGDTWHFEKLTIAGEGESFQFMGAK